VPTEQRAGKASRLQSRLGNPVPPRPQFRFFDSGRSVCAWIQDAPLCLLVCSTGYDEGADCSSMQGWHCLYRSGAERATCFYSQSAHRTNAQAADWFEFPIVHCFLRPLRSSRESCIAERISSTTDEIARE
jgi:hypothetical protein